MQRRNILFNGILNSAERRISMKKKIKSILALIMALAMVMGLCASTAFADDEAADESSDMSEMEGMEEMGEGGGMPGGNSAPSYVYATYIDESLDGITLSDDVSYHNGIVYETAGEYTLSNSTIYMLSDADGSDTTDFTGLGAAVMATGTGVVLTIENTYIETSGVAKPALITLDGAVSIVKSSTLISNGGVIYDGYYSTADTSMMVSPPWVLGLGGDEDDGVNARTTNILGNYTVAVYIDSTFQASGWGALSVDTGDSPNLVVINCDVSVLNSGYGAYAINYGGEEYYGVNMDVTTYGVIMTGARVTFQSYTEGQTVDVIQYEGDYDDYHLVTGGSVITTVSSEEAQGTVYSVIDSENFGFMFHSNASSGYNEVNLYDGTQVTTGDAVFLIKKICAVINVDDSTLESGTGVILQIIDNDDDYVGTISDIEWGMDDDYGHSYGDHTPTFNLTFTEEEGYSNEWIADTSAAASYEAGTYDETTSWTAEFTLTNSTVTGDIWNSSGYVGSNPATVLSVTLGEGADLTGQISAGAFSHTSKYAEVGDGDWSQADVLGHVTNIVNSNGVNTVNVTLTDDAVWTVTGDGIIDTLSVTGSASVVISEGATLTVGDVTYEAGTITETGYTEAAAEAETEADAETAETEDTDDAAEVGDSSNMVLWMMLAAFALCGGSIAVIRRKCHN